MDVLWSAYFDVAVSSQPDIGDQRLMVIHSSDTFAPLSLSFFIFLFYFTDDQGLQSFAVPEDHLLQGVELMELALRMGIFCSKMHAQNTEAKLAVRSAQNILFKCARDIMGEDYLKLWELEWQSKSGVNVLGLSWNAYVSIWAEVSQGEYTPTTRVPNVEAQTRSMVCKFHGSLLIYCLADSVACQFVWEDNSSSAERIDGLEGGDQGDYQGHEQEEGRRVQ